MSKDEKLINGLAAMNELDEALIAEALAPAKKRRPYWAYAAAALILTLGAVFAVNRLLRAKEPDITVSSETQSPAATGEATEPTAPPFEETEAPSEPAASALPTGTEQTDTPAPTEEATGVPTAKPSSEPTAQSSARPTATPAATPKATATPVPTALPTGGATPAPTARPTLTPKPTSLTTPRPTPSPTATPRPTSTPTPTSAPTSTPTPTPEASLEPQPSSEPVGATYTFFSEESFVSAVLSGQYPELCGLDRYYTPAVLPEGASFSSISAGYESVFFNYSSPQDFYRFGWLRSRGASYIDYITSHYAGYWKGGVYILQRSPNQVLNAYFVQYGELFKAVLPAPCTDSDAVSFCAAIEHSIG